MMHLELKDGTSERSCTPTPHQTLSIAKASQVLLLVLRNGSHDMTPQDTHIQGGIMHRACPYQKGKLKSHQYKRHPGTRRERWEMGGGECHEMQWKRWIAYTIELKGCVCICGAQRE